MFLSTSNGDDTVESYVTKYYEYVWPCVCDVMKNDKAAGLKSCTEPSSPSERVLERMVEHNNILERLAIQERVTEADCKNYSNDNMTNPDANGCWADQSKMNLWSECMGYVLSKLVPADKTESYIAGVIKILQANSDCYKRNGGTEKCLLDVSTLTN